MHKRFSVTQLQMAPNHSHLRFGNISDNDDNNDDNDNNANVPDINDELEEEVNLSASSSINSDADTEIEDDPGTPSPYNLQALDSNENLENIFPSPPSTLVRTDSSQVNHDHLFETIDSSVHRPLSPSRFRNNSISDQQQEQQQEQQQQQQQQQENKENHSPNTNRPTSTTSSSDSQELLPIDSIFLMPYPHLRYSYIPQLNNSGLQTVLEQRTSITTEHIRYYFNNLKKYEMAVKLSPLTDSECKLYRLPFGYPWNRKELLQQIPHPYYPNIYNEIIDDLYKQCKIDIFNFVKIQEQRLRETYDMRMIIHLQADEFMPPILYHMRRFSHFCQPIYREIVAALINMEYARNKKRNWKYNLFTTLSSYEYIEDAEVDVISGFVDGILLSH